MMSSGYGRRVETLGGRRLLGTLASEDVGLRVVGEGVQW